MAVTGNRSRRIINIVFISLISIIVIAIAVVLVVVSQEDMLPGTTEYVDATPTGDTGEYFDVNNVALREDPIIMTVDGLGVKLSEFNYFYYISASEILESIEYPQGATTEQMNEIILDTLESGIDGKSFDEIIFERAKRYSIKYVLYRLDAVSAGFIIDESYKLYLESNFMNVSTLEELEAENQEFEYEHGVVRNEYINILLYNNMIENYKQEIRENAKYSDEDLKALYDESSDLFTYKQIRTILLNSSDTELANTLKARIDSGYDMELLVSEYSISATKSDNKGILTGNIEDFSDENISLWLDGAKLNETTIINRDEGIYIIKYENDGSFELRKQDVSDYKAVYDYDASIDKKITDGEISVIIDDDVASKLVRPRFTEEFNKQ